MTLMYRGTPYTVENIATVIDAPIVEGQYHGLKTKIRLPQISRIRSEYQQLLQYRGVTFAA